MALNHSFPAKPPTFPPIHRDTLASTRAKAVGQKTQEDEIRMKITFITISVFWIAFRSCSSSSFSCLFSCFLALPNSCCSFLKAPSISAVFCAFFPGEVAHRVAFTLVLAASVLCHLGLTSYAECRSSDFVLVNFLSFVYLLCHIWLVKAYYVLFSEHTHYWVGTWTVCYWVLRCLWHVLDIFCCNIAFSKMHQSEADLGPLACLGCEVKVCVGTKSPILKPTLEEWRRMIAHRPTHHKSWQRLPILSSNPLKEDAIPSSILIGTKSRPLCTWTNQTMKFCFPGAVAEQLWPSSECRHRLRTSQRSVCCLVVRRPNWSCKTNEWDQFSCFAEFAVLNPKSMLNYYQRWGLGDGERMGRSRRSWSERGLDVASKAEKPSPKKTKWRQRRNKHVLNRLDKPPKLQSKTESKIIQMGSKEGWGHEGEHVSTGRTNDGSKQHSIWLKTKHKYGNMVANTTPKPVLAVNTCPHFCLSLPQPHEFSTAYLSISLARNNIIHRLIYAVTVWLAYQTSSHGEICPMEQTIKHVS